MQDKFKASFADHALHPRPEGRGFPRKIDKLRKNIYWQYFLDAFE